MLLIVGVGLLGLVVGSVVGYLLAKRGDMPVVSPNKSLYFKGFLEGYDACFDGYAIDVRSGGKPASDVGEATHALLLVPHTTESGIRWGIMGTASPRGVKYAADKIA